MPGLELELQTGDACHGQIDAGQPTQRGKLQSLQPDVKIRLALGYARSVVLSLWARKPAERAEARRLAPGES